MTPLVPSCLVLLLLLLPAAAQAWEEDEPAYDATPAAAADVGLTPVELPPRSETRAMLHEILAQPEFNKLGQDEKPEKSLLELLNDWLNKLFGNRVSLRGQGWPGVGLVVLLLLCVVYLLVRLYLGFTRTRAARAADAETEQLPATPDALIALAQDAAAAGDFRRAVRLLFNAAVKRLNMPTSSLQTNYQVLAFTRRNHLAAESALRRLVTIFEDAWYGSIPCGQAEYSESEQLYRSFSSSIYEEGS